MPRPQVRDQRQTLPIVTGRYTRYLVVHQDDLWFVQCDGDEYGPYKSDREAMVVAIDAAQILGEQGAETQVLLVGESGDTVAVWTYGQHPYRF